MRLTELLLFIYNRGEDFQSAASEDVVLDMIVHSSLSDFVDLDGRHPLSLNILTIRIKQKPSYELHVVPPTYK